MRPRCKNKHPSPSERRRAERRRRCARSLACKCEVSTLAYSPRSHRFHLAFRTRRLLTACSANVACDLVACPRSPFIMRKSATADVRSDGPCVGTTVLEGLRPAYRLSVRGDDNGPASWRKAMRRDLAVWAIFARRGCQSVHDARLPSRGPNIERRGVSTASRPPRIVTIAKRPSQRGRTASCIYSYRNIVKQDFRT